LFQVNVDYCVSCTTTHSTHRFKEA
jgi:hypothetical protein